ncbi:universal stress protein [Aquimarina brevivitae]|uniref:Nucleotide-binding universal stress UspA family protein n=1 Tax=Aquimarina brevivitae TaxID=323412 RepID=A0A4Q7PGQ6_9FLAO|nr:universal stress protein [Aquimarina brevivitae]RZS99696.1 nucleotide-binding universal stress UspA family protein [Aquimarina brevivitae]
MRKVIIPTDFSENALNAIKYAVELLKYERGEFHIVHAYAEKVYENEEVVSRAILDEVRKVEHEQSKEKLGNIKSELQHISPNPNHNYFYTATFGILVDVVNDLVEDINADLVIMGTRGLTNDRQITFGSNTMQIMKYVRCPVLSIPEGHSYTAPKWVVFPTDFMLPYKRRELKLLYTMVASYRSLITLLYFSENQQLSFRQQDNKKFIEEAFKNVELEYVTQPSDDITAGINHYLQNQSVDLLVMVNSRHSYLENILFQSTIDKIGLQIQKPFLVMQNLNRD